MKWEQFLKAAYPEDLVAEDKEKRTSIFRFHRWIGVHLGYVFYHLGISANFISVSRIVFSVIPLYLIAFASRGQVVVPLIGVFLLYFQHFFDSVDGVVARVANKTSVLGAELDSIANDISRFGVLFLLGMFLGNLNLLLPVVYLAFFLVAVRRNFIKEKVSYDTEYKGFARFFRVVFSIQVMLFVLPLLVVSSNFLHQNLALVSGAALTFYAITTLFWFILCFFKKEARI